jgi:hypothetical protein
VPGIPVYDIFLISGFRDSQSRPIQLGIWPYLGMKGSMMRYETQDPKEKPTLDHSIEKSYHQSCPPVSDLVGLKEKFDIDIDPSKKDHIQVV